MKRSTRTFTVLSGATFILTAFCTRAAVVSTPSASPTPATSGNLTGLIFDTSETEERLTEIDRCTREFAQGWTHTPYEINNLSYSAMWCNRGFQQSGCFTPDLSNLSEEQHLIELSTDFYNNEFPKVHGFELRAIFIPRSPNWGVDFHLKQGGANSAHDGFGMAFTYYSTTVPAISLVSLGDDYEYEVHETDVVLPAGLPPVNELADYIESAESMRDRGVARLDALQQKVVSTITSHQVLHCDYGAQTTSDVPPPCNPRALTYVEESQALAEANAYFSEQKQLLADNHQEMYATLFKAFPVDRCGAK